MLFEKSIQVFIEEEPVKDIYVNEDLLGNLGVRKKLKARAYEIKGKVFEESALEAGEEYAEFQIEEINTMESHMEAAVDTGMEDVPLVALTIQEVHGGVVVNSNVYLAEENWHTLVRVGEEVHCAVCRLNIHGELKTHIDMEEHKRNLKTHLPLNAYDLCIMKKISGTYHCGVCNITIDAADLHQHLESKGHEELLLFAINKVSDLMCNDELVDRAARDLWHFTVNPHLSEPTKGFYDYPQSDYEEEQTDYYESPHEDKSPTYASMAATQSNVPKVIEVVLGHRKAWVEFDTWHMVLCHRPNRFYCMACRVEGPKRRKVEHCREEQHLSKLLECTVIKQYQRHLVRRVDDRLVHCGHCNNLQLSSDMEEHLETRHPIVKSRNLTDTKSIENTSKTKVKKTTDTKRSTDKTIKNGAVFRPNFLPETKANFELNDSSISSLCKTIEVVEFDHRITVSLLAYNMNVEYHCVCCGVTLKDVRKHLGDLRHLYRLKMFPFLTEYGRNLIRAVNMGGALHCALCNVVLQNDMVNIHINGSNHITSLRRSVRPCSYDTMEIEPSNQFSILSSQNRIPDGTVDIPKSAMLVEKTSVQDQSVKTQESDFNTEKLVYLKFGNSVLRTCEWSYNSLVFMRNGTVHCFLCSEAIPKKKIEAHIARRDHQENIEKHKFLEDYGINLLRQMYVNYHCGVCNVMFTRNNLTEHLKWPLHLQNVEWSSGVPKKERKNIKQAYTIALQKEMTYTNTPEPIMKIQKFRITNKTTDKITDRMKNRLVLSNKNMYKIEWKMWNGYKNVMNSFWCTLCQRILWEADLVDHSLEEKHARLTEGFLAEYAPALIRKINQEFMNCVTCNTPFSMKTGSVTDHLNLGSHIDAFESITDASLKADSYTDCEGNIFTVGE